MTAWCRSFGRSFLMQVCKNSPADLKCHINCPADQGEQLQGFRQRHGPSPLSPKRQGNRIRTSPPLRTQRRPTAYHMDSVLARSIPENPASFNLICRIERGWIFSFHQNAQNRAILSPLYPLNFLPVCGILCAMELVIFVSI